MNHFRFKHLLIWRFEYEKKKKNHDDDSYRDDWNTERARHRFGVTASDEAAAAAAAGGITESSCRGGRPSHRRVDMADGRTTAAANVRFLAEARTTRYSALGRTFSLASGPTACSVSHKTPSSNNAPKPNRRRATRQIVSLILCLVGS